MKLVEILKEKMDNKFPDYIKKYIILEAHNETKWSYHVIVRMTNTENIPIVFKNVYSCKVLYNELNFDDKKVFDWSVYREGLFRTIESSKPREKRPFIISELSDKIEDIRETFVCYSPSINTNPIVLEYSNPKHTITSFSTDIIKSKIENVELSNEDKHEIQIFIRSYYKHNPNYIRDIIIDTQCNCIIVSLNERYCEFIHSEHKSNHQYIIIDLTSSKQKCHDTECDKQAYNEIQFYNLPENIQSILRRVLILNNNELISEAVESAKIFINEKFDDVQVITFDKKEMLFRGEASQILNKTIRGRCSHCRAEHQISSTGYCLKCNTCQATFPKDLMIPIDHQTNSVLGKFWTFINNGTVNNNNNITIINQNAGEEEFNCDVQLDNSIFKNKELTKLLNQILDGHKVVLISQLMSKLDDDFKYTNGEWYHFNGIIWKADKESLEFRKHIVKLSGHFSKIQKFYESKKAVDLGDNNFGIIKNVKSLINKLHKTGFEDEVIKGAKMFYYDEYFISRLNSKKHLVPFTNGIYDLLKNEFRKSSKDDYINLTVSYNYKEEIQCNFV